MPALTTPIKSIYGPGDYGAEAALLGALKRQCASPRGYRRANTLKVRHCDSAVQKPVGTYRYCRSRAGRGLRERLFQCRPDKGAGTGSHMDQLRRDQNSVGAKITVVRPRVVPPCLASRYSDRLDAELAYALMSINAAKGFEIGAGFAAVAQLGTEHRDELTPQDLTAINSCGVLGWYLLGQPIVRPSCAQATPVSHSRGARLMCNGNPGERESTRPHDPLRRHSQRRRLRGDDAMVPG